MTLGEATKRTKESVGFEHPAKGSERCFGCRHFLRLVDRCRIVEGKIMPQDWCEEFSKRVL
jgi:hypothetical protein